MKTIIFLTTAHFFWASNATARSNQAAVEAKRLATTWVGSKSLDSATGNSLASAIRSGDHVVFKAILRRITFNKRINEDKKNFDINMPIYKKGGMRGKGDSLLRIAFEEKQLYMAMRLLRAGGDIDIGTEIGRTPFDEIVSSGLLDEALIIAAFLRDHDLANRLINLGANPNAHDEIGMLGGYGFRNAPPLIIAAVYNHTIMMKDLLLGGANANATDRRGRTALHYSSIRGNHSAIDLLIYNGADPNILDSEEGFSALHRASGLNRVAAVRYLLLAKNHTYPINPNIRDKQGNTPIITAASYKSVEVIEPLIDGGADPNATNNNGETAFLVGAQSILAETIEVLAANGANVHATDKDGNNAFHLATKSKRGLAGGKPTIFEKLSALEVNINAKNNAGQTPLDIILAWQAENPRVPMLITDTLRALGGKTAAELD